jgi:DNA polymerase
MARSPKARTRSAAGRAAGEARGAAAFLPANPTLRTLRAAADGCRGCDLYKNATQTVFGAGTNRARVVLVGEQPGNEEDLVGKPFVGPAGRLLDRALDAAGIDRSQVYVTNVVKHFKSMPRGKRRIHMRPNQTEIEACRPWLDTELLLLQPDVLVLLGATAAQALLGRKFRVSTMRGQLVTSPLAPHVLATVHPSSVLRAPDDATRHAELQRLIEDLQKVVPLIAAGRTPPASSRQGKTKRAKLRLQSSPAAAADRGRADGSAAT